MSEIKKSKRSDSPPRRVVAMESTQADIDAVVCTIKSVDMPDAMKDDAIICSKKAVIKFNLEKDMAAYVKKEFDRNHGPTWHCVVGRNYGSYVTHETGHFIYLYVNQQAVLLFKAG